MKKILLVIMAMLLALSLFACAEEETDKGNIDDYAAPDYTHKLTDKEGGGTVTFEDGHAESAVIVGYTGKSVPHAVTIPSTITVSKRDVTGIGDEAFYHLSTIKSIELPDTVTFIGKFAFAGCTALETIVIPKSVTKIEKGAFYGCTALKSVVFDGSELIEIGDSAFQNCTALETIKLPEGLETLGKNVFDGCAAITAMKMPSTLKSIGDFAFIGCIGLDKPDALELSASITEIGECAFSSVTNAETGEKIFGISKNNIKVPADSYAAEYVAAMAEEEERETTAETESSAQ